MQRAISYHGSTHPSCVFPLLPPRYLSPWLLHACMRQAVQWGPGRTERAAGHVEQPKRLGVLFHRGFFRRESKVRDYLSLRMRHCQSRRVRHCRQPPLGKTTRHSFLRLCVALLLPPSTSSTAKDSNDKSAPPWSRRMVRVYTTAVLRRSFQR